MKSFNEQQKRLWISMIKAVDSYINDSITFPELVSSLHGALQAGDFMNKELVEEWYKFWGNLEIHNAVALDRNTLVDKNEVLGDIHKMKRFLLNNLSIQANK